MFDTYRDIVGIDVRIPPGVVSGGEKSVGVGSICLLIALNHHAVLSHDIMSRDRITTTFCTLEVVGNRLRRCPASRTMKDDPPWFQSSSVREGVGVDRLKDIYGVAPFLTCSRPDGVGPSRGRSVMGCSLLLVCSYRLLASWAVEACASCENQQHR